MKRQTSITRHLLPPKKHYILYYPRQILTYLPSPQQHPASPSSLDLQQHPVTPVTSQQHSSNTRDSQQGDSSNMVEEGEQGREHKSIIMDAKYSDLTITLVESNASYKVSVCVCKV